MWARCCGRAQGHQRREVGTFNDDTRPTSSQAITLIGEAVVDIEGRLGRTPPAEVADAGRSTAAMCLIELSYHPEEVRSDRSAFQEY